jgi:hypothetical protein
MWFHFMKKSLFLPHLVFYSVRSQQTLVHTAEPGHGFLIKRRSSVRLLHVTSRTVEQIHTLQARRVTALQVMMCFAPTITGPYCKRRTGLHKIRTICHLSSLDREREREVKPMQIYKRTHEWNEYKNSTPDLRSWNLHFDLATLAEIFCSQSRLEY